MGSVSVVFGVVAIATPAQLPAGGTPSAAVVRATVATSARLLLEVKLTLVREAKASQMLAVFADLGQPQDPMVDVQRRARDRAREGAATAMSSYIAQLTALAGHDRRMVVAAVAAERAELSRTPANPNAAHDQRLLKRAIDTASAHLQLHLARQLTTARIRADSLKL
jgi:hypothetical protein